MHGGIYFKSIVRSAVNNAIHRHDAQIECNSTIIDFNLFFFYIYIAGTLFIYISIHFIQLGDHKCYFCKLFKN